MVLSESDVWKRVRNSFGRCLLGLLLLLLAVPADTTAGLPMAEPAAVGLDGSRLQRIDEIVAEGLAQKKMPG